MAEDVSAGLIARQGRRFGLTVGTAFLVFAAIAAWRAHPVAMRILASLGIALIGAGLLAPATLLPAEQAWMRMAHVLSRITTPIVLGAFYFLIVTPLGVGRRMFGRHGLPRARPGASMWKARPEGTRQGDLTRQF